MKYLNLLPLAIKKNINNFLSAESGLSMPKVQQNARQKLYKLMLSMLGKNFSRQQFNTRRPWWPCKAHLSIIALREPDLELIKANILTKIHDDYINK